jgi:hypothetical protein
MRISLENDVAPLEHALGVVQLNQEKLEHKSRWVGGRPGAVGGGSWGPATRASWPSASTAHYWQPSLQPATPQLHCGIIDHTP